MCPHGLPLHTSVPLGCLPTSVTFPCLSSFTSASSSSLSLPTQLQTQACTHPCAHQYPHLCPGDPVCANCLEAGGCIHTSAHNVSHGPGGELSNTLSQNSAQGREHNAASTKCSGKAETCQGRWGRGQSLRVRSVLPRDHPHQASPALLSLQPPSPHLQYLVAGKGDSAHLSVLTGNPGSGSPAFQPHP